MSILPMFPIHEPEARATTARGSFAPSHYRTNRMQDFKNGGGMTGTRNDFWSKRRTWNCM